MKITFSGKAFSHYLHWQQEDPKIGQRINELLVATMRQPFTGIGKPEPLRNELSGFWSRRITQEHRLIYRVTESGEAQVLEVAVCRHYY
jgi:toxin YoeB